MRGRPFETSADWMWATTDGVVTTAMQRIHDVAHQLTQLEIDLGRYDAADAAAQSSKLESQSNGRSNNGDSRETRKKRKKSRRS